MDTLTLKSSIIAELKEKIKRGDTLALTRFWNEVEIIGTPLIESIEGDSENMLVTFIYKSDEPIENVVCASCIGGWYDFPSNKLENLLSTNLWYITYKVRNDVRFTYLFSVNDSLKVDCEKRCDTLTGDNLCKNILVVDDNYIPYVKMPNSVDPSWPIERNDVPKGNIYDHEFHSDYLGDTRKVIVYTPYGYEENNKPYGFLILTDGDDHLNHLSAHTILDNLIADKKIDPIIAIFIDSTENRYEELACNDKFGNMIVKELLPWAKGVYNISNDANDAIISGFSLGGLNASYTALKHPEVFGNVLSQSGSYWYNPENSNNNNISDCWLGAEFEKTNKLPIKFYLNVGILECKKTMTNTNRQMRDVLISKGYDVAFEELKSGHNYFYWGYGLANGLLTLIGK